MTIDALQSRVEAIDRTLDNQPVKNSYGAIMLERDALRAEVKRLNKEIDRLNSIITEHYQDAWEEIQRRIRLEFNAHPGWKDTKKKEPWERPIRM